MIAAERAGAIAGFLAAQGWAGAEPAPLAGDASFRRYFRLADGGRRAVLMDAPPPEQEKLGAYIQVADTLRRLGFSAPDILAEDRDAGLVRRCLGRLDEEEIRGRLEILRVLSDTAHVQTQGPVWYVGGRVV